MKTILVVDDDPHIREVVRFALESAGFAVVEAENGRRALASWANDKPELIVLDLMMPELDGHDTCREIRKSSTTPIIFLTAKSEEIDMIIGLELGGDDYLAKPFSPRHLVARVKSVLRRCELTQTALSAQTNSAKVEHGHLSLHTETFKAFWQQHELTLTVTEFNLLRVLAERPDKVFSREELMQKAYENTVVSDRTIDSHIRRVRAKITAVSGDAIETIHGLGYKLGCAQ